VATYLLAREVFGETTALLSLPLAALSPWLIFMSGEYYSHVPGAVATALFLTCAVRAMERASWRAAALSGFLLGVLVHMRPPTALPLCVPTAVVWGVWLLRRPSRAWRPSLAFGVALAVPMAALLLYNAATTGGALTFAVQIAWKDWAPLGSDRPAVEVWRWRPEMGISNLVTMFHQLNEILWRWPVPAVGLLGAGLIILGVGRDSRESRVALLLLFTALAPVVAYARWFWVSGAMRGPRYIFEAMPLWTVLGAGVLFALYRRLVDSGAGAERVRAVLTAALLACFAYAGARAVRDDLPVCGAAPGPMRMVDVVGEQAERPALVFVPIHESDEMTGLFYFLISQNDPALSGPIVFARDLGPRNELLAAALPGRHHYRWDHAKFGLVPIDAEEAR
jgi:4-amino-4-deoxy-L-arabinose transferase-like glycosyltransferase